MGYVFGPTAMMFLLVCGGAFLWGIANVMKKHFLKNRDVHEDLMVVGVMLGGAVFCLVVELLWSGESRISSGFWIPFAITAFLNIGIQYWNVRALKLEDASIVVPLSATMPMFVIVMSWVLLREWPTFYGRVGITAVALGSYVLNLKGAEIPLPSFFQKVFPSSVHGQLLFYGAPWFRIFSSKGAKLALATAYLGAVAVNFDKLATLNSSPMIFSGGAFLVVAGFVYLWSKVARRWDTVDKRYFKHMFVLGLFLGLVTVLLNAGYLYGIVPYVGTLKRIQILWTVVLASIF